MNLMLFSLSFSPAPWLPLSAVKRFLQPIAVNPSHRGMCAQQKKRRAREGEKNVGENYVRNICQLYKMKWRERGERVTVLVLALVDIQRPEKSAFLRQCQRSERVPATAASASAHQKQKERNKISRAPRNENNPMETRYRDMYITGLKWLCAQRQRESGGKIKIK